VSRVLAEDLAADLIMATIVPEAPTPYLKVSGVIPQPGEKVITLGSPSGEEWTAADGIVSAVREKKWHGRIKKFVQISAPISHGSSGGPAINLKGEVIGVNTFTREKSQNLNFSSIGQNVLDLKPGSGVTLEQRAAAWVTEGKEEVQQGVQAMHAKKNQDALVHLKNARLLAPELPEVYYNIGLYYLAVGNQKEAAVAAKKLKDLNPQLHQELVAQFKAGGKSPKAP